MKIKQLSNRFLIRKSMLRAVFILVVSLALALIHNANNENGLLLNLTDEKGFDEFLDLP